MSVRVSLRTPEQEAEAVADANYELLKEEVFRAVAGKLRSESITTLNHADLEEAYNRGWHGVIQHIIKGRPVTSLAGLLYRITHRRALDIYRLKHESRHVEVDLEKHVVETDVAEQIDDQQKLDRLMRRLMKRLTDKERRAITLCVLYGYKRPEAADKLGVSRVVFERTMDSATAKMSGIVASLDARGCGGDEWARALRAYALGALGEDEPDYQRIYDHTNGKDPCQSCRRYVNGLRGLAAVCPPLLPGLPLAGHETGILSHLVRIFGGGHGATAGGASATTIGAAGGGGGTVGAVLSSGAAKTAMLVVAALGAVGAGTSVIGSHHTKPKPVISLHEKIAAGGLVGAPNDSFAARVVRPRHSATAKRYKGRGKHASSSAAAKPKAKQEAQIATAGEFSFEKHAATTATTVAPRVASTSSSPPTRAGEPREFSLESNK
jgi:RNA polymerase sigma factor (sigma-70 family)